MNKTILIVEDEKHLREIFSDKLKDNHYKVLTVGDGIEALKIIKEKMPDLVILDMKLSGVTGIEILAEIRQYDKTVPVIVCTAVPQPKLETSYERWATEVIIKPVDLNLLLEKVNGLIVKTK